MSRSARLVGLRVVYVVVFSGRGGARWLTRSCFALTLVVVAVVVVTSDAEVVVTTPSGEQKTVPISYVEDSQSEPMKSRAEDESPFAGGGWIHVLDGDGNDYQHCSAGFAIFKENPRVELMVTAAHCGKEGYTAWDGSDDATLGTFLGWNNQGDDIQVIKGGTYNGRIYTGGVSSSTSKPVIGSAKPYKGQVICVDGTRSGQICKAVVTDASGTFSKTRPETGYYYNQVAVKRVDGKALFGKGDSGGPVYSTSKKGLTVAGVISGGFKKYSTTCISEKGSSDNPRQCFSSGTVANIYSLYKDHPLYHTIKGK